MAPKEIPDRWEPYIPIGSPVRGTRFIALKVPLKEHVCAKLQPKLRWTIDILTSSCPDIGMIVDFTMTTRYYDFVDVVNKGVDYCKVAIPGQQLPSESLVKRFFAAVDYYLDKRRDDSLIGIHCTHGVNRTGYMIARYMIQRMGISVSDALESITVARGHPIERQNYISDLGRHLEQMPKVLDASDIHRGRSDGEALRTGGKIVKKKKKPMDSRMGPSKKNSRRRRRQERQQRRLEGQQTEAPSEVVVIDSDSDDCVVQPLFPWTAENSEGRLQLGIAETTSREPPLASIKVRNLDELMDRPRTGEQTHNVGGLKIKDFFSLADERLKKQLEMDEKSCDVQNVTDRIDVEATQSCSFTPSDGKQSQELESEKQGGNNLTTVVTVQGKPSDVRVAIRVKDISLLTRKPSETSSKSSSYSIGCDLAEAGTTGDTISTSVTVDDSTDINVAIRLKDISSLTDNPPKEPVERLQTVAGESEILEPDCSFRSRDDLLPRNLSGASVRVNPLENKVEKAADKKPDAEKAYQVGKDGNSTLINSKKSKKRKKPKKPKKKKNKLKNVPQQDSNLQNFSQHVQHPSVPQTSDFSEVNSRPHFYTESSSTDRPHFYSESSSTDRPHFYSESSSTDRPHFYTESSSTGSPELRNQLTGLNPFTRNKHLDRAVIQDMRVERRKLRKEMRRQRKQELNNWAAQRRVPFHSDRAGPLRSRFQNDFGNCESAQSGGHGWNEHPPATSMRLVHSSDVRRFDPYKNPGMPPPWQRSDGRCNFWPSFGGFGVVSGGISRDNRLQRSSVQASNDSNPPESFTNPPSTSESSRPPENMEVSRDPRGVEESKSNQTPETKPFSDAVKSTNITRPTVIVSPKNNIQHQIAQRLLDLKPNMKSEVKFEVVPNLGVARSQVIPPVPDKSSLQQTFAPSSSVSETPSTNSSASIAAPTTTKLPWSALSDTSWSSLFHK